MMFADMKLHAAAMFMVPLLLVHPVHGSLLAGYDFSHVLFPCLGLAATLEMSIFLHV